ncbi:hypothetical protein ALC60_01339 [Trachymyrmex zeteki]|uniref:Uncharacterized protein n=1 Tax=Mycetomoellerius zeteki TaxID=64791 RepID=A0A151XGZ6_9HYME|nr:PREDICTED: uncharacterized protein LOC108729242 [Trachymyrmex zeteki]KYQ59673.1 hypothetical protein ALC60_01339 [Trachymyrmex zeteki]
MKSDHNMETDNISPAIEIQIQKTLISIDDVSLKIKKELEVIKELTEENGHLRTVINATNQTLSKKVQKIGVNVVEIIRENKRNLNNLESNLLDSITSTNVTEKLDQLNK